MAKKIIAYLYPTPRELRDALKGELLARKATCRAGNPVRCRPKKEVSEDLITQLFGGPSSLLGSAWKSYLSAEDMARYIPLSSDFSDAAQDLDSAIDAIASDDGIFVDFDEVRARDEFVWITHSGSRRLLSEMATQHIFYSLRMIYNHSVPPAFRVGEFKRYPDVPHWSPEYKRDALDAFDQELRDRTDGRSVRDGGLDKELQQQLDDIRANAEAICKLGL